MHQRSHLIPDKFDGRSISHFRVYRLLSPYERSRQTEHYFFRILHFITFLLIYSLCGFSWKQREYEFFSGGHPRRFAVTLSYMLLFGSMRRKKAYMKQSEGKIFVSFPSTWTVMFVQFSGINIYNIKSVNNRSVICDNLLYMNVFQKKKQNCVQKHLAPIHVDAIKNSMHSRSASGYVPFWGTFSALFLQPDWQQNRHTLDHGRNFPFSSTRKELQELQKKKKKKTFTFPAGTNLSKATIVTS